MGWGEIMNRKQSLIPSQFILLSGTIDDGEATSFHWDAKPAPILEDELILPDGQVLISDDNDIVSPSNSDEVMISEDDIAYY